MSRERIVGASTVFQPWKYEILERGSRERKEIVVSIRTTCNGARRGGIELKMGRLALELPTDSGILRYMFVDIWVGTWRKISVPRGKEECVVQVLSMMCVE